MTKYTVWDSPDIDRKVEAHLQRTVANVISNMEPVAIILRGSFGRGEGSVVMDNGQMRFLSDYEFDVATYSPFHRSLFRSLSHQLTDEFGVDTSLRWVRPDYLYRDRIGPLPMGAAPVTISLYESRYGSQTLFGKDVITTARAIHPEDIQTESAVYLLMNRMAESLLYMDGRNTPVNDLWKEYYWIGKTVLACAESLLLIWGNYHFSYAERGRRFLTSANSRLNFMGSDGETLCGLVARATEFKLRPRLDLYAEPVSVAWRKVIPICEKTFRYVAEKAFEFHFQNDVEFPTLYLRRITDSSRKTPLPQQGAVALLNIYKCLRARQLLQAVRSTLPIASRVYAVVPLMYASRMVEGDDLSLLLVEIRKWLEKVTRLEKPDPDPLVEREILQHKVIWAWKNFCYL